MNYGEIKNCDIANGIGVRVSLFVSGCTHRCKGCFNEQTWDFNFGQPFTSETENYILNCLSPSYIKGLTILGGEPLEKENQAALLPFVKKVREVYPEKNIWCYTGYDFEKDVISKMFENLPYTKELISLFDVVVDGRFIEELKDITLKFRGSSNQRVIDVKESLNKNKIVLYME
jgi:anaerobic ribonucleoside-triphosphate reductase activating protein